MLAGNKPFTMKVFVLNMILCRTFFIFLCSLLLVPVHASALVSEGRPGVPYFDQVLFMQTKVIENDKVVAVSLAFADPKSNEDLCLNRMDVFGGLEKFRDIPENNWVLVDFELQSLLIAEGFAGDADVSWVVACPDVDTCMEWGKQRSLNPQEQERRANFPRPEATVKANFEDISQRLKLGRKLVKAARCRGCHNIEGSGPNHAPSLTWKRVKYDKGWLENYLKKPYRMRPAMDNLMMLNYTSPNAMPRLQQEELEVVAEYLESVAVTSAPGEDQRREVWEDYDCFDCHVKLYKAEPLVMQPTALPEKTKAMINASPTMTLCLDCHAFADMHPVEQVPASAANAFAPDLLFAFEKLNLGFISNFMANPAHLVPLTQMPNLKLREDQILEINGMAKHIKEAIEAGEIKSSHGYYNLEKKSGH
jgi:mono/diheme cytochrome c family protein